MNESILLTVMIVVLFPIAFATIWFGVMWILASTDQYLYLDVPAPFRPGHPALRIPWRDIEVLGNARWPRRHHRLLRAGRPPLATLTLPEQHAAPRAAAGLR